MKTKLCFFIFIVAFSACTNKPLTNLLGPSTSFPGIDTGANNASTTTATTNTGNNTVPNVAPAQMPTPVIPIIDALASSNSPLALPPPATCTVQASANQVALGSSVTLSILISSPASLVPTTAVLGGDFYPTPVVINGPVKAKVTNVQTYNVTGGVLFSKYSPLICTPAKISVVAPLSFRPSSQPVSLTGYGTSGAMDASVEVWFNTTTPNGVIIGSQSTPFPVVPTHWNPILYVDDEGYLKGGMWMPNVGQPTIQSPNPVIDGNWHHAVWTGKDGNLQSLYLDGKLIASASGPFDGSPDYYQIGNGFGLWWSGTDWGNDNWRPYTGYALNATVYPYVLPADQVSQNCKSLAAEFPPLKCN